ncbi:GAF domain-containing protein [Streptomyces sp. G44]|uniref:GAF domain-containing protein n=1 Tax=Streptomyces sp. G44 TaxID=2807632 RepID=UPI00196034CC|nr:GAF domain-containing protein [Streptomyces sp. G44]MBM7167778.1 GAF domain-containing protein [Streptomyces sp. G44]
MPGRQLLLTPVDEEAPARVRRLRELGLGDRTDPALDLFADRLAELTGAPYAMVNFLDGHRQFFAGLHAPDHALGRYLARDHGYCPYVVARRKALVLEDVRDYPRFAGNPVVDETGIRSYLGAPLIDRTRTVLGTVCVVDVEPRRWGRAGLDTIKTLAAELVEQIHRREDGGI